MNDKEEGEGAFPRGESQLSELQRMRTVLDPLAFRRWDSRKNVAHSLISLFKPWESINSFEIGCFVIETVRGPVPFKN